VSDAEYHILGLLKEILHVLKRDGRILHKIEQELLKPELQSSGAQVKTLVP